MVSIIQRSHLRWLYQLIISVSSFQAPANFFLKNAQFLLYSISPPEKEVVHPCEAEVARGEADIEKNWSEP